MQKNQIKYLLTRATILANNNNNNNNADLYSAFPHHQRGLKALYQEENDKLNFLDKNNHLGFGKGLLLQWIDWYWEYVRAHYTSSHGLT